MKIRQCFLELQLKMSGMFFETQCRFTGTLLCSVLSRRCLVVNRFKYSYSSYSHKKRHKKTKDCSDLPVRTDLCAVADADDIFF